MMAASYPTPAGQSLGHARVEQGPSPGFEQLLGPPAVGLGNEVRKRPLRLVEGLASHAGMGPPTRGAQDERWDGHGGQYTSGPSRDASPDMVSPHRPGSRR